MRPHGSQEELEKRRRRAIALLKEGKISLSAVARTVGASKSSVSRWYQEYQKGGSKALRSKTIPGRPPKLSQSEKGTLTEMLLSGPLAAGYRTDLWTLKRIAQTIHKHLGIRYHPNHVWRILQGMGWSCQKPERRALQRNDKEIVRWEVYRWPRIKKAERLGAHLVFMDESGFLLIPNIRRTWAPKGKTPIFYHLYKQDRISSINALSVSPKRKRLALYLRFRRRNLNGLDVRSFLKALLKHLRGPMVLLWDRGTIHRRKEVKQFLLEHPRIHMEYFPAYAPELNPAEYVWNQTDRALSNSAPESLAELKTMLQNTVRRLRRSPRLLWSCIYASDLPWRR